MSSCESGDGDGDGDDDDDDDDDVAVDETTVRLLFVEAPLVGTEWIEVGMEVLG